MIAYNTLHKIDLFETYKNRFITICGIDSKNITSEIIKDNEHLIAFDMLTIFKKKDINKENFSLDNEHNKVLYEIVSKVFNDCIQFQ